MENETDNIVTNEIVEDKIKIDANFGVEDLLAIIAESSLDNTELIKEIKNTNEIEGIAFNDAEINETVVVIVGKKLLECTAKEKISAYEKVTFITIKDESTIYVVPLKINVRILNIAENNINPATEEKQDNIIAELQLKANLTETQPVQLQTGTNTVGKFIQTNGDGDVNTHSGCAFSIDYIDAIAHELIAGYSVEFAAGKKTSIGIGAFTLLESQPFIQPPSTPGDIQMYFQSTSAEDGVGGTGIQELTFEYFSLAWGQRKIQTVATNGITQVAIPNVDKYRLHKVYGNKGDTAVGNITITNEANSILYGQISQYRTYMERCIFYLAENETVTVTQAIIGSTTNGGVNVVCFVTEEDANGNMVTRGRATIEIASNSLVVPFKPHIVISNLNNKRKAVGLSVNGNLSNQKCTATLNGIIEVN